MIWSGWQVTDNYPSADVEYMIQRTNEYGELQTAAICWDYGLACVIEATMNLKDDTVD